MSHEQTTKRVAKIASRVLKGKKPSAVEAKILAGSVLTQARHKKSGKNN